MITTARAADYYITASRIGITSISNSTTNTIILLILILILVILILILRTSK